MTRERDLIGLCLKNSDAFERALLLGVSERSFVDPICASIFLAMRESEKAGDGTSLVPIVRKLGPQMAPDIASISADSPTTLAVDHFALEVYRAAWVRMAQESLRDLSASLIGRREDDPIEPLQEQLENLIDSLGDRPQVGPKLMRDVMPGWIEDLEERMVGKRSSNVTTGFESLDTIFNGGWHRGAFYVVAARPGRGKTTFALSSAINGALAGFKTLVATVEMSARDMATKAVSNLAHIRTGAFVRASLTDDENDRLIDGVNRIGALDLWVDDAWRGSFEKFASHCRRIKRRDGLDVAFLDYIGLTTLGGRHDSRREMVVAISMACKALALELDIAIIALAQLNRNAEDADRPGKEHIAESDNLGRDPDGVLLIYRQPVLDDKGKATVGQEKNRVAIAKNRWGVECDIPIEADLAFSAFRSAHINTESFT